MNIARKIAEGVGGWLMYELHSKRNELFSEKYLTAPIGNILHGQFQGKDKAEYNHPTLSRARKTPGRPPQLDFVIIKDGIITVAVESKWIGRTQISIAEVIWDLIRLELIAKETGAKCYFVLEGQKRGLKKLFEHERFLEATSDGRTRPVLRLEKGIRKASLRLSSPIPARAAIIKHKLQAYPDIEMPSVVGSDYPEFYLKDCRSIDYQVYVWEIFSSKNHRFKPGNNSNYK